MELTNRVRVNYMKDGEKWKRQMEYYDKSRKEWNELNSISLSEFIELVEELNDKE